MTEPASVALNSIPDLIRALAAEDFVLAADCGCKGCRARSSLESELQQLSPELQIAINKERVRLLQLQIEQAEGRLGSGKSKS